MSAGTEEGTVERDLEWLTGECEERAHAAFARLWEGVREPVVRMLARRGMPLDEAEDVAQIVGERMWRRRTVVRAGCGGEWYVLVRTDAQREAGARAAKARRESTFEDLERIPAEEMRLLDAMFAASEAHRLIEAADDLWLGEADDADDAVRGTVALQHLLIDGLSTLEVRTILGASQDDLTRWLNSPALLARALFGAVCWPGDAILGYVLWPERPLDVKDMNALIGNAPPPETLLSRWSEMELRILALRLREGRTEREILAEEHRLDAPTLDAALARMRAALPFRTQAERFCKALAAYDGGAMPGPGLWKRAALAYDAQEGLPHKQIVERAGPPAEATSFRLDAARLNNWLSMGRLYAELARSLMGVRA